MSSVHSGEAMTQYTPRPRRLSKSISRLSSFDLSKSGGSLNNSRLSLDQLSDSDSDDVIPECILRPKETALRKQRSQSILLSQGSRPRIIRTQNIGSSQNLGSSQHLGSSSQSLDIQDALSSLDIETSAQTMQDLGTMEPMAKWRVEGVGHNTWRKNTIDDRTLYGMNTSTLRDSVEFPVRSRPPSADELQSRPRTCRVVLERALTRDEFPDSRKIDSMERRRFRRLTLQEVHKPDPGTSAKYCAPTLKHTKSLKELLNKEPKVSIRVAVPNIHRCRPIPQRGQYCEVLGPVACTQCIEKNNRQAIQEIHEQAFPAIDCSVTKLVAPTLASVLTEGSRSLEALHRDLLKGDSGLRQRQSADKGAKRVDMNRHRKDSGYYHREKVGQLWRRNDAKRRK